ncbi:MAG: hypothetical protein K9L75_05145 [Spirochaetia bacterium]|nr:hypothetical protein [Spirochaetia bacterium]
MSEEERKAAEQKERAEQEKKDKEAFLQDVRLLSAERAGLSEEDAVLIPGSTQEEIRDNGKRLKELMKSQFAAGMEQAKKSAMNGGTPKGGDHPPKGSTNTQLQNLFKDK